MLSTFLKFYIPFYILSTIFCYFTNRKWLIKNDTNPDYSDISIIFCPFINLIFGIMIFIENLNLNKDSICKKFFNIK